MKKSTKKKVVAHLDQDIKGYQKQRKDLKGEIKEDIQLKKSLKRGK